MFVFDEPIQNLNETIKNQKLKLLEVGSGPTSNLAWGVDQGLFEITAVDPLANSYNELMKQHNYVFTIKPMEGVGEELLNLFGEETFHIIFSQNAIDHAVSPQKCILNMYSVLKEGGILYLCGNVKEGTNNGWYGLHQHDLIPIKDQLYHFDRNGNSRNLTENLKLKSIFCNKTGDSPGDWYTIIFEKIK